MRNDASGARQNILLCACFFVKMPEKGVEFFEKSIFFLGRLWYDDKQDFYGSIERIKRERKERGP